MHLAVRTIDFDYPLPEELIADRPLPDRAASRMLVLHRDTGLMELRPAGVRKAGRPFHPQ